MANKQKVLALKIHKGDTNYGSISLPNGCLGMCFVFDSKKSARAFWGNDVELVLIETEEINNARD